MRRTAVACLLTLLSGCPAPREPLPDPDPADAQASLDVADTLAEIGHGANDVPAVGPQADVPMVEPDTPEAASPDAGADAVRLSSTGSVQWTTPVAAQHVAEIRSFAGAIALVGTRSTYDYGIVTSTWLGELGATGLLVWSAEVPAAVATVTSNPYVWSGAFVETEGWTSGGTAGPVLSAATVTLPGANLAGSDPTFAGLRMDFLVDDKLVPGPAAGLGAGGKVDVGVRLDDGRFVAGGTLGGQPWLLWLGPKGALLGQQVLAHPSKPAGVKGLVPRTDGSVWAVLGDAGKSVRVVRMLVPPAGCL